MALVSQIGGPTSALAGCSVTYAAAGSHTITATYSGTETFAESTSAALSHEVVAAAKTPTQVDLSDWPEATSTVGEEVTYYASITPVQGGIDYGALVAFSDDGSAIAGCEAVSVALVSQIGGPTSALAGCSVTYAAAGSHTITATYSGTETFG